MTLNASNIMYTTVPVSNSTVLSNKQPSPGALIITLMCVIGWIVLANAFILTFLFMNRRALKNFVNLQILSFSVTDMLVGLLAIPTTMTYHISMSFPYFWPCAAVLYGYSAAQHATLYHAFVICIHRLVTIKRCTGRLETNPRSMYKLLFIQISIPWIESLVVMSIPYLALGKHGAILKGCSLNTVFEDNYIAAMGISTANILIPHIGMNVIYVYMLVFLLKKWNRINVLVGPSNSVATTSRCADESTRLSSTLNIEMVSRISNSEMPDSDNTLKPVAPVWSCEGSGCNRVIPINQPNLDVPILPNVNNDTGNNIVNNVFLKDGSANFRSDNNQIIKRASPINRQVKRKRTAKLGVRGQKDVLITIGILLLVLNVFMTPLSFLVIAEVVNVDLLNRQVKFTIMVLALMNSALNPIIYMFRIKPFREALGGLWNRVFSRCCSR